MVDAEIELISHAFYHPSVRLIQQKKITALNIFFFIAKNYFVIGVHGWRITAPFSEMLVVLFVWL